MVLQSEIMASVFYQNYVEQCHVAARYASSNVPMTEADRIKYNLALIDFRIYLDKLGMRMPSPKYPYDPKDKKTWKWLDNKHLKFGKVNNLNANWIYYTQKPRSS